MRVLFYYRGSEHIGLESIMAYVQSKGHLVELIYEPALGDNGYVDIPWLNNFFYNDELVINKALRFKPDLICFSAITNLYMPIKNLAKQFKKLMPDVPIIVGGIHPTSLPDETISEEFFDMICLGEGEGAMADLLQRMREKRSYNDIKNLWVKDSTGHIHKNTKRPIIKPLESLPDPDKSFFAKYGALSKRIMIMTTRGCPFACTFCVNSFRNAAYSGEVYLRQRSVKNVIADMVKIKNKYNPTAFRFEDDVFGFNQKWLDEFKVAYKEQINLPFHCYVTPSTAKDSILKALAEAGCESVSMGIQSGSEKIRIKLLHRRHTDELIIAAAERINKHGIRLYSQYIFGFPEETPEEMWKAFELNDKLNAYNTASFIFYPYPKTALADYSIENGYLSKEDYDKVKAGYGSYHTTCWLDLPYKDEVYKYNSLLPLWNVTPKFFKPLLKLLLKMKFNWFHRLVYNCTFMFIDFDEFVLRVREMPHMIMATRKALKNDDWDQSYEDQYILESEYKKSIKLEKIVDVIPAHIIEKDKLDKELKEKRRKAHFFHGKIQFPQ
jgi:radical SAM superfamily enzyme YgiQ (UPF0313 family)